MPFADECNSASAIIAQWFSARDIARQLLCVQCACTYTCATECVIRLRWLAETTGLWVPAVIHGTALLPDDDGGRLLWILASGLPREASGLPRGAGF